MREIAFAIPGDPAQATGGYGYARSVMAAGALGARLRPIRLPDGFPFPSSEALTETERLLAATPAGSVILVDGLAFGALPVELLHRVDRRWVALCHHPLALETGLSANQAAGLRTSEIAALALAGQVVVTSGATAELVAAEYHVPSAKITIAAPGVTRRPRAAGTGRPPILLCVGAVVPRKGYEVLIPALAQIRDRAWICRIVGALDRDPATVRSVRAAIDQAGLGERITLAGTISDAELDRAYADADIFVHPAHFEGYGMAVADALAAGLPVIAAAAEATKALVSDACGALFPIGDAPALAAALTAILDDDNRRRSLADGAWAAGQSLPDWPQTASLILGACDRATA